MSYIVLITGPSGVGKTTVMEKILERIPNLTFVPSYSTRPMRESETDGDPYFFISEDEFNEMSCRGEFIEFFNNYGNWYGSPTKLYHEYLEKRIPIVKAIDVRGALSFKSEFEQRAITVFLSPPNLTVLRKRLEMRDGIVDLERYRAAKEEMEWEASFDISIVNEDLEDTVDQLCTYVRGVLKHSKVLQK